MRPGDQLVFSGSIEHIGGLQAFRGLKILGEHASDLLASNLVEAVIAHESDLVYKTLQEIDFRGRFNAGVVGIRRGNKRLTGRLGHTILHVGDSLILAVGSHFAVQADLEKHFHILSTSYTPPRLTNRQGNRAIAGFILAVLLETLNLLPLLHGLLLLLGVYLLAGYTSIGELRRRIPFELIAIIGSAIAGGLSALFGCTLPAPHGGIWVIAVIGNPLMYAASVLIGSVVGALIISLWKKALPASESGLA